MNTKLKKIFITIATTLSAILIVSTATYAIGTLTPSDPAGSATQYTLNDIYTKLTTNTATSTKSGSFATPVSVVASFRTLTEIYDAIPTIDATKVATGTSYLGVMGTKQNGVVYPTQWSADYYDPIGETEYLTWQAAMDYCDTLTENTHTDWRLPSYIELVNAYLTTNPGNTLGFQGDYYWSSSQYPGSPSDAYYVGMSNGDASNEDRSNPSFLVRCTR